MTRMMGAGLALAGILGVGCGHAVTTGSAQNDWATPVGHATATNPRVVNPMMAAHGTRDRSLFARREAPPLQPNAQTQAETPPVETPAPLATPIAPEPPGMVPPPAQPLPPPETVPEVPPYVEPVRP